MGTTRRFAIRHGVLAVAVLICLVIAVRRGAANAPPGRYTITNAGMATGTVLDTETGLTWQQTVPGSTYTQADALTYCASNAAGLAGTGWRVASMQELQTLVDDSQQNLPAVDPVAFPNTPTDNPYWTSSTCAPVAGSAWLVNFDIGGTNCNSAGSAYRVRCVR